MAYHIDQPQPQPQPWSQLPCNPQAPLWETNQGILFPHPQMMQSQMQQPQTMQQASMQQAPMQPSQVNQPSQRWFQSGPSGPGFYLTHPGAPQQGNLDSQSDGDWHVPRNPPPQTLTPPAETRFMTNGARADPWMGAETNNYSPPLERNLEKISEPWQEKVNDSRGSRQSSAGQSIQSTNQNSTGRHGDDNEIDVPQSRESQNGDEGSSAADNLSTASTAVEESTVLRDMIATLQEEMKEVREASTKQAEEFASLKATIFDSQINVHKLTLDINEWTDSMDDFALDFSKFTREWNSVHNSSEDEESEEEHSHHSYKKKNAADAESERDKRRNRRAAARQKELSAKIRKKW
ncbi:uncharacterized protein PAC_14795 [Phialocephala subalpina]|uniref:Uncharacterized protein n=1 Tax=Phialocephala subalpina TaxID=576137 RepID=A0A1L7XIM8_9HELO|nr:uncharacterized protein PAC_14795 [Phialocephala subalpina]